MVQSPEEHSRRAHASEEEAPPIPEDQQKLERWIKNTVFEIDPKYPDPGRVTVRRLNRVEYRNTIHDLMGINYNADAEFPPDDTGYGFDDIGDVLTISPMLMEKYLAAANDIVGQAVPTVARVIPEHTVAGRQFMRIRGGQGGDDGRRGRKESSFSMSYYEAAFASNTFMVNTAGSYTVGLDLAVKGTFEFDPGQCRVVFKVNDHELLRKEFGWYRQQDVPFRVRREVGAWLATDDPRVGTAHAGGSKT